MDKTPHFWFKTLITFAPNAGLWGVNSLQAGWVIALNTLNTQQVMFWLFFECWPGHVESYWLVPCQHSPCTRRLRTHPHTRLNHFMAMWDSATETSVGDSALEYHAICDAGSTGTRLYVLLGFNFRVSTFQDNLVEWPQGLLWIWLLERLDLYNDL